MRNFEKAYLAFLSCLVAQPVWAHTDQVTDAGFLTGFMHPIAGPDHVLVMVAVGLWGAFLRAPAMIVLPIAFPVVMAAGGTMGRQGLVYPGVETGIALSALVIGGAVALMLRPPLWVAAIIVAIFAVFHGHAHGTEMPSAANPASYAIGFVTATGLLHLAGIAIGLLVRTSGGTLLADPGRSDCDRRRGFYGWGVAALNIRGAAVFIVVWPLPLSAHDAFGDIGPFYQDMLHPVVDPLQGLLVIGAAIFLARQPLQKVRFAFPAFVLAALIAIFASLMMPVWSANPRALAVCAALLGIIAAAGLRPGYVHTTAIAAAAGLVSGSLVDPIQGLRTGLLTVAGGSLGLAAVVLLVWGFAEIAECRLSPYTGAVVGGWVAAVGLMLTALPD